MTSNRLAEAVQPLLFENATDGLEIANSIEFALADHQQSRMQMALLCAKLQQVTGLGPSEISRVIADALPDLVKSLSWVTKLVKADCMLLTWPQLHDVANVDKLTTLVRIPCKLQPTIFETGRFPDGTSLRDLDREQLAAAVRKLRSERKIEVPKNPYREARRQLIGLLNVISVTVDQISPLSKYSRIREQLIALQLELKKVAEDAVIPRNEFRKASPAYIPHQHASDADSFERDAGKGG